MTMRWWAVLCVLACAAGPAGAEWLVEELGDNETDADRPTLAVSPGDAALVAWEEYAGGVWTRFVDAHAGDGIDEYPTECQGNGHDPVAAWTWRGFLLVWINGQNIHYRYGDGSAWGDSPQTIVTGLDLSDVTLDLQGCAEPGWNVGWLAYTVRAGAVGQDWFVRVHKGGHDAPAMVASCGNEWGAAQVASFPSPDPRALQPVPRYYFIPEFARLAQLTGLDEGGWEPAAPLPHLWYGSVFDVRGRDDGSQCLLALEPQPTCPCNTVVFSEQNALGVWSGTFSIMTSHDFNDWPHSPRIAWGAGDEIHAFWVQPSYGYDFEPGRTDLEYHHRVGGAWQDGSAIFDAHERRSLGLHVALEVTAQGEPLFAWTRQDTLETGPQPRRVWLARPQSMVGAPATVVGGLELAAWPNPGRSRIALAGSAPLGGTATLAVYDLAGRQVATPVMSADGPDHFAATWDGRDSAGRDAPAGVYLMRLSAAGGAVTRRVVLAR
ncbi:MAG: T9SS type A sorting domain-containing protein [bacterium]|nr:T9SS type A sorting domain-containing protein [bacterium]